jgi:hypothetical protein
MAEGRETLGSSDADADMTSVSKITSTAPSALPRTANTPTAGHRHAPRPTAYGDLIPLHCRAAPTKPLRSTSATPSPRTQLPMAA